MDAGELKWDRTLRFSRGLSGFVDWPLFASYAALDSRSVAFNSRKRAPRGG